MVANHIDNAGSAVLEMSESIIQSQVAH